MYRNKQIAGHPSPYGGGSHRSPQPELKTDELLRINKLMWRCLLWIGVSGRPEARWGMAETETPWIALEMERWGDEDGEAGMEFSDNLSTCDTANAHTGNTEGEISI